MRRNKQMLTKEHCIDILNKGTNGVLAFSGDNNYPYTVPISYVYDNNKIYFHCAKTGHKIDAINSNNKVSFCVVTKDEIKSAEFTTYYESVIVFGKAKIISEPDDLTEKLLLLSQKYSPNEPETINEINKFISNVLIVEINIEHLTGKCAKELIK